MTLVNRGELVVTGPEPSFNAGTLSFNLHGIYDPLDPNSDLPRVEAGIGGAIASDAAVTFEP